MSKWGVCGDIGRVAGGLEKRRLKLPQFHTKVQVDTELGKNVFNPALVKLALDLHVKKCVFVCALYFPSFFLGF